MAAPSSKMDIIQKGVAEQGEVSSVFQELATFTPDWSTTGLSQGNQDLLLLLERGASATKTKMMMQGHLGIVQACMEALLVKDVRHVQWTLTFLWELFREDSSAFNIVEEALKKKVDVCKPLLAALDRMKNDSYVCDKAAWILSGIISHMPGYFKEQDVQSLVNDINSDQYSCSEVGRMDACANLLKTSQFRAFVWEHAKMETRVIALEPDTASPLLYKTIFCFWLISFDQRLLPELKNLHVVTKVKEILTTNRVEKVARICLTLLKNLLVHKALCEEIVEAHVLESVQGLEYEKWRDAELYEEIREMVTLISHEVLEFSNFDRYERELKTGQLAWGFIHTSKFWADNFQKFEQNEYAALKKLAACLHSKDTVTLAVACHDIGCFVTLHPVGKKKVAELAIKESVMTLMAASGDDMRDVRREALLCCQKIMLNRSHTYEMEKGK